MQSKEAGFGVKQARPATAVRLVHASLVTGVILFGAVTHFVIKPARVDQPPPSSTVLTALLGVSLAATALGFVLRSRVPRRNTDESADLFWTTAMPAAMVTWAPLEAGALFGIVAYLLGASPIALGAAALAAFGMIVLRPGSFERRS